MVTTQKTLELKRILADFIAQCENPKNVLIRPVPTLPYGTIAIDPDGKSILAYYDEISDRWTSVSHTHPRIPTQHRVENTYLRILKRLIANLLASKKEDAPNA